MSLFSPPSLERGGSGGNNGNGKSSGNGNNSGGGSGNSNKYSPYTPPAAAAAAAVSRRLSSTDSVRTGASTPLAASSFSLLESLAEFNELQSRIRQEQEGGASSASALGSPPPYPVKTEPEQQQQAFGQQLPPPPPYTYSGGCVIKTEAAEEPEVPAPSTCSAAASAVMRVKMEPVLSLVMEQARKDIDSTCRALNISNGKIRIV